MAPVPVLKPLRHLKTIRNGQFLASLSSQRRLGIQYLNLGRARDAFLRVLAGRAQTARSQFVHLKTKSRADFACYQHATDRIH